MGARKRLKWFLIYPSCHTNRTISVHCINIDTKLFLMCRHLEQQTHDKLCKMSMLNCLLPDGADSYLQLMFFSSHSSKAGSLNQFLIQENLLFVSSWLNHHFTVQCQIQQFNIHWQWSPVIAQLFSQLGKCPCGKEVEWGWNRVVQRLRGACVTWGTGCVTAVAQCASTGMLKYSNMSGLHFWEVRSVWFSNLS